MDMDPQLPSPHTSVDPKSPTPAASSTRAKTRNKNPPVTFKSTLKNDRNAIRKFIQNFLDKPESRQPSANMMDLLVTKMNEKLSAREAEGKATVRTTFPDLSNPDAERAWLRHTFPLVVHGDEDMDDEEILPSHIRIKQELLTEGAAEHSEKGKSAFIQQVLQPHGNEIAVRPRKRQARAKKSVYDEQSSGEESDPDDKIYYAERRDAETEVLAACDRSNATRYGCAGMPTKSSQADVSISSIVGLFESAAVPVGGVWRSWQFRDGKLVVWPPFGDKPAAQASFTTITAIKPTAGVDKKFWHMVDGKTVVCKRKADGEIEVDVAVAKKARC
ncbi:hypothetical protein LTR17_009283 [Elasticomyces elasticus]|nr:hypothetical protein LTR17_009283 [Elasticomyces elasticus]